MHTTVGQRETRLLTQYQRGFVLVRAWRRLIAMARACTLRLRGAHIGRMVSFGKDPQFYGVAGITIGDNVNIGRRARIETQRTERGQAQLSIGSGTHIGNDFHAGAALRVLIGRNCRIASGATVLDHDHDLSNPFDAHLTSEGVVAAPTVIEDCVFL
jgi:acetyltransferase-like isoleucine patch superfamily enzyme